MPDLPLLRRFPALAGIPRASLGTFPTPVERVALSGGGSVWVKRDDRTGAALGGNKVRALEWLLGALQHGDHVLTMGPTGSTHALSTAFYAHQLGARTTVVRWNQEMNPAARAVDERLRREARVIDMRNVVFAYMRATLEAFVLGRPRWIPAGGTTPLGILGYVNGALELAEQIERGECPAPDEVVVPLGTGGTASGVALGLHIAGLQCRVRAVRVAPSIIASGARVAWLIQRTRSLMEAVTREPVPSPPRDRLVVDDDFYGGGYGRPLANPPEAPGLRLDDTYSAKAFAAARSASGSTVFWLTFDGRLLRA